MGIGDYPCGVGPCGFDPVGGVSARSTNAAAIPYYDPSVRGFATLADGDLRDVHPVVQEASFALGVELGSIPAAPRVGLNVNRIKAARTADVQRVAEDEVNIALRALLDAGDIRVQRVVTFARGGAIRMDTEIVNLRDPNRRPVTITGVF